MKVTTGRRLRLTGFLLVSAGVHLWLLAGAHPGRPELMDRSPARMAVALVQPEPAPPRRQAEAAPRPRPAIPQKAEPATRREIRRASTSASTDMPPQQARAELQHRLQTRLAEHFSYPLLARRHGYQGTVTLSFRIQSNGTLHNIRIAKSSGYGILDLSALKALCKVRRLENMEKWLQGGDLDMQLPVHYRLEG